jgi:hypothetical protein
MIILIKIIIQCKIRGILVICKSDLVLCFLHIAVLFFSLRTKSWQQSQMSQYARGFGSAAASPYSSSIPRVIYSMGKSRDWMYSIVETSQMTSGYNQFSQGQSAIGKFY